MTNTIYIGAPVEGVQTNEIFTARPTALIKKLTEKFPLIGQLFVPIEIYGAALEEMQTPGTVQAQAYLQTKKK